jgi:uracil phosphoribosyltransferase
MEKGLRDCCRSIRIGKILIQSETGTSKPQVSSHSNGRQKPKGKQRT